MTTTQVSCTRPQTSGRPRLWHYIGHASLCGLAWAAGLRGFMAQVAGSGSEVEWAGTFALILAPGRREPGIRAALLLAISVPMPAYSLISDVAFGAKALTGIPVALYPVWLILMSYRLPGHLADLAGSEPIIGGGLNALSRHGYPVRPVRRVLRRRRPRPAAPANLGRFGHRSHGHGVGAPNGVVRLDLADHAVRRGRSGRSRTARPHPQHGSGPSGPVAVPGRQRARPRVDNVRPGRDQHAARRPPPARLVPRHPALG